MNLFSHSIIVQNFTLGKTNLAYTVSHVLAPYFHDMSSRQIKYFSFIPELFDEPLKKVQETEVDVCIQFGDSHFK